MTTPTTPASPPQLDYGLAPSRRRKRAIRLLILGVLLVLGLAAWQWGAIVWNQGPIVFWQRQCMRYTAAPNAVVYEEDPAEVSRLLARGFVRYKLERGGTPDPTPAKTFAAAAPFPYCWKRLTELVPPKIPLPGSGSGAILFLHERTTPQGTRRLVCIRYFAETYSFTAQFVETYNIEHAILTPGDWSSLPTWSPRPTSGSDVKSGFPRTPPQVRIYAGQVDPDDSACFTIRYQMWGKEDVLDGRLREPGYVTLAPRKPPTPDWISSRPISGRQ